MHYRLHPLPRLVGSFVLRRGRCLIYQPRPNLPAAVSRLEAADLGLSLLTLLFGIKNEALL